MTCSARVPPAWKGGTPATVGIGKIAFEFPVHSTWLHRLTVNGSLGKLRQRKKNREIRFEAYLPNLRKDRHLAQPSVDWVDTPEEKYARREMQALLSSTLHELKPIDKRVTVLSYLEGRSAKEIATTVGLTVSAVKTRLHRARCFLRERLFQVRSDANIS
jgi:RNA polymerase sigma-70 factor, ECF subfamily